MSERIRVLHVIESMHQGGAESLLVEHARHGAPDIETLICALNRSGPAFETARTAGARMFLLGGERGSGAARPLRAVALLARLIRTEHVDIVHGHNPIGGVYGALAARLAGVSVVFRTEHSVHYPGRYSRFYPLLEPLVTALTRRVVCVCQAVLESHVRRFPRAARRFVVVINGISPGPPTDSREAVLRKLRLSPEARVVLTVGSLTPQKAQNVLLEAFVEVAHQHPQAQLLLVGEGPLRANLEARLGALGLAGRARLLGARGDVADLLTVADLFVLPSLREGLPITVIEAMRSGRAVIATDVGGNGEAVENGVTGFLVPPGHPAALATAMGKLLDDPERAAAMGTAGRTRWAERFTAERMMREMKGLYRGALATAGQRSGNAELTGRQHGPD